MFSMPNAYGELSGPLKAKFLIYRTILVRTFLVEPAQELRLRHWAEFDTGFISSPQLVVRQNSL